MKHPSTTEELLKISQLHFRTTRDRFLHLYFQTYDDILKYVEDIGILNHPEIQIQFDSKNADFMHFWIVYKGFYSIIFCSVADTKERQSSSKFLNSLGVIIDSILSFSPGSYYTDGIRIKFEVNKHLYKIIENDLKETLKSGVFKLDDLMYSNFKFSVVCNEDGDKTQTP